ncbi:hypothetical protein Q3G72_031959 [Acer saccharum]|nr:hypothetical protein Q3G72_031959 [Acer saccharum]
MQRMTHKRGSEVKTGDRSTPMERTATDRTNGDRSGFGSLNLDQIVAANRIGLVVKLLFTGLEEMAMTTACAASVMLVKQMQSLCLVRVTVFDGASEADAKK